MNKKARELIQSKLSGAKKTIYTMATTCKWKEESQNKWKWMLQNYKEEALP